MEMSHRKQLVFNLSILMDYVKTMTIGRKKKDRIKQRSFHK